MPRAVSSVTALPADGSLAGATQTFITPSTGAIQLRYLPSGLICTPARSGLPNSASRGISSTSFGASGAAGVPAVATVSSCLPVQAARARARLETANSVVVRCMEGSPEMPGRHRKGHASAGAGGRSLPDR